MSGITEPPLRASRAVITLREAIALGAVAISGIAAWFALSADVKALTRRMEWVEPRAAETHDTVIELRTHQRNQQQQLNRIEGYITGRIAPTKD